MKAVLTGSCAVLGSRVIPSEEVDRAFGMPAGKLRSRAGIESLAYVAESEGTTVTSRNPRYFELTLHQGQTLRIKPQVKHTANTSSNTEL